MRISLGSERLLASNALLGKRVGVVCNPASIDHGFGHITDRIAALPGVTLATIFGPQHGFRSDVQENMIESGHGTDDRRRVPVYSLYSETRVPTPEMMAGLDVLVIDLQDVGVRYWTFQTLMKYFLKDAVAPKLEVVVLDRQDGPALETSFGNAGEISPGYASPWAAPGIPLKALKWLFMRHRPLFIWPKPDPDLIRWGLRMLMNCTAARYEINKGRMVPLAEYSRDRLRDLRQQHGIALDAVHHPMFVRDSAGPESGQSVLQGFGFSGG